MGIVKVAFEIPDHLGDAAALLIGADALEEVGLDFFSKPMRELGDALSADIPKSPQNYNWRPGEFDAKKTHLFVHSSGLSVCGHGYNANRSSKLDDLSQLAMKPLCKICLKSHRNMLV